MYVASPALPQRTAQLTILGTYSVRCRAGALGLADLLHPIGKTCQDRGRGRMRTSSPSLRRIERADVRPHRRLDEANLRREPECLDVVASRRTKGAAIIPSSIGPLTRGEITTTGTESCLYADRLMKGNAVGHGSANVPQHFRMSAKETRTPSPLGIIRVGLMNYRC